MCNPSFPKSESCIYEDVLKIDGTLREFVDGRPAKMWSKANLAEAKTINLSSLRRIQPIKLSDIERNKLLPYVLRRKG